MAECPKCGLASGVFTNDLTGWIECDNCGWCSEDESDGRE